MAIEELNAKKITVAGKTLKFELVSEDDQCDARSGVSVAQKFVDSGVKYVLGPYCSGVTIPASRVYSQGGAMVSTVAPTLRSRKAATRTCFASSPATRRSARTWPSRRQRDEGENVAVIDDRTAFGQGWPKEFSKEAKKLGLTVVGQGIHHRQVHRLPLHP